MRRLVTLTLNLILVGCTQRLATGRDSLATRAPAVPAPVPAPASAPVPVSPPDAEAALVLPIPARNQAPEAPESGWCGETAIQEGLLHTGVWSSQEFVNHAGRPSHPDLYSSDIPVALDALHVRYTFYSGPRSFTAFAAWVKDALDAGDPVLAGVKILPTKHPEWGLDHFVLIVGHGSKGLLVNTTWGRRAWVDDTTTTGLSFENVTYGIRLRGLTLPANGTSARVSVLEEQAGLVRLRITCEGVADGVSYRVERRRFASDRQPLWSETGVAANGVVEKELVVEADRPSRFHCVRISGNPAPAGMRAATLAFGGAVR